MNKGWHVVETWSPMQGADYAHLDYMESAELFHNETSLGLLNEFTDKGFCHFLNKFDYPFVPEKAEKIKKYMETFYTQEAQISSHFEKEKVKMIQLLFEDKKQEIEKLGESLVQELKDAHD